MVAVGAQFAALIRILGEYFRLRGLEEEQLTLVGVDPWIEGALLATVFLVAGVFALVFERYRLTIGIAVATVIALLVFNGYLISTGRLPGWI